MTDINKISILGAGALGAAYASMLYEMDERCVSLVADGSRFDRLQKKGFYVNGKHYVFPLIRPDDLSRPDDLVIVALKHHHLPEALNDIRTRVGDDTIIMSVMNGMESEEQISGVFGEERLLYAISFGIDAVRDGNIITYSSRGKLHFGEAENSKLSAKVKSVKALFDRAGFAYDIPQDMIKSLWWKFMINVGINQTSAVLKAPYGVFQKSPDAMALMESAMREVIEIAKAVEVDLSEEDIRAWQSVLMTLSPDGKTSMLQDVEARRKTEVEMFAGKVIELGLEYGIPTPVNSTLFRILKVLENN